MDVKEIHELIALISRSAFTTFELEREGFRLKLVKGESVPFVATSELGISTPAASTAPAVAAPRGAALPDVAPAAAAAASTPLVDVTSPIVGTFYRAPGPGADAFVETGSRVRKGQVLCIIEAMKLMNEIEAEIDGEIVEICVKNAQPVEFGEVLFRLRPAD